MKLPRVRDVFLTVALLPRKLAKSLSRWMPSVASPVLTTIALDGQWFKLLQVEGPLRERRITKLVAFPVEGRSSEEVERGFKQACLDGGHPQGDWLVATPSHLCTVRFFSLPSTDPKEIRDIVELQAEKHTPYAKDEILTDFTVIDRDRSGYSRVLLVIAHQDVVYRSVRLVESSGLVLDRVGCELEGLINFFLLTKRRSGAIGSHASLVVDVDGSTTTVLVMQGEHLQFHRSLATGAEQLQEDPVHAGERLVSELQRSIEAIEPEANIGKPQEVVLTGRMERLGAFKALIERGLEVPVHLISPLAGQASADAVRAMAEQLPDVSFAGLVGLAFAPSALDLTPQATKLRHAFEAKAKALVLLGCQGIGVLILVSLLVMSRAQKEHRYDLALRKVHDQSSREAVHVEEALQQVAFIKQQLRQRGMLLEAVETLASLSPKEIRWNSLTFSQGEGVVLKGTSTELPRVYEFVAGLDSTPLFDHVEAKRTVKRKSGEDSLTDFDITCPIVTAGPPP